MDVPPIFLAQSGERMATTQQTGQSGEKLALDYLVSHDYAIITTNWHCKFGEIDIVARKGDVFVFVEVRTRRSSTEDAYSSIDPKKQRKMVKAAYAYLAENNLNNSPNITWQIDVIAVARPNSASPIIEHTENALDW